MALFGNIELLKQQVKDDKFNVAFKYLEQVLKANTVENKRLLAYALDAFEKIDLDEKNFVLEQVYNSKERAQCFFESHRKYIDVQLILEGEEIIEVAHINRLKIETDYDNSMDLLKYHDTKNASSIKLQEGDVAIFYPEDAHMPCLHLDKITKVVKTVVKVAI